MTSKDLNRSQNLLLKSNLLKVKTNGKVADMLKVTMNIYMNIFISLTPKWN